MQYAKNLDAWSDGLSPPAAKALTTSYVAHPGGYLEPEERANLLCMDLTLTGTEVTTLHLQVLRKGAGDLNFPIHTVDRVVDGVVVCSDIELQPAVAVADGGRHTVDVPVPPGGEYIIAAKRTGGDATSKLLLKATWYSQ